MALVPVLNPATSGSVTRNPATAPSKAIAFAPRRFLSPAASTASPATIGTQTARLSQCACISAGEEEEPGEQHRHSGDHQEGVVVDESRLQPAHHAREPADELGR